MQMVAFRCSEGYAERCGGFMEKMQRFCKKDAEVLQKGCRGFGDYMQWLLESHMER